jgi:23S rRNA pseudouridine2605 synthase
MYLVVMTISSKSMALPKSLPVQPSMQRVQKLLSNYGYCSRREAEKLIIEGRVCVNGEKVSLGDKAAAKDKITVDGKPIDREHKVYIMLNKPTGCVSAVRDRNFKTVMEYVKVKERVFPIGRLDFNTSGLLLLTNDGDFANRVMHPRYGMSKTYLVELDRELSNSEKALIEKGIMLDDGKTSPAQVLIHPRYRYEITIKEGKKRVIRRIFEKLRIPIHFLIRVRIGDLKLGGLKPGMFIYLKLPNPKDPMSIFKLI